MYGTVSVPERVPTAVGVNVTPIVHVRPAPTPAVHVFDATAKSPFLVGAETVRVVLRWFVNVTVFAAVVSPTVVLAKVKVAGEIVTDAEPVPVRLTVWGLFSALSVNVSVPESAPVAAGENVIPTVHVAPAAMLVPQVLLVTAKSPLARTLVKLRATFSWLVNVTVLTALALPTTIVPKLNVLVDNVTGTEPVPVNATV